jgi:hypothetical protein
MHMYEASRTMRLAALGLVALAAGACFNPKVKNRSFVCDETSPACPTGFVCRSGFCDDGSGGPIPVGNDDLSMPGGTGGNGTDEDMSMPASGDMASLPGADMSMPADLSTPADMAKPNDLAKACQKSYEPCTRNSDCCNNTCFFDGTCL